MFKENHHPVLQPDLRSRLAERHDRWLVVAAQTKPRRPEVHQHGRQEPDARIGDPFRASAAAATNPSALQCAARRGPPSSPNRNP